MKGEISRGKDNHQETRKKNKEKADEEKILMSPPCGKEREKQQR